MKLSAIFLAISSAFALPAAIPQTPASPVGVPPQDSSESFFGTSTGVDISEGLKWYIPYAKQALAHPVPPAEFSYIKYCGKTKRYPTIDQWQTLDALWQTNLPQIQKAQNYQLHSATQINQWILIMKQKILEVSEERKVDARLILATIMQESTGSLNVPCTAVVNCGIMQGPPGSKSFDSSNPENSIKSMIHDGIDGHSGTWPNGGPGLAWFINSGASASEKGWTQMTIAGNPYQALRAYNTGKVLDPDNLDTITYGTASYVNDVANRLMGWDGTGSGLFNADLSEGCQ